MTALPVGDGDSGVGSYGEKEGEKGRVFPGKLLDDVELILNAAQGREGGSWFAERLLKLLQPRRIETLLLEECNSIGEELHLVGDAGCLQNG